MNGANLAGNDGENLQSQKWQWAPAIYIACLLVMNILSSPLEISEMPEDCPEDSMNCDKREVELDVGEDELHQAMQQWADQRSFTTTFSQGHIVDRTLFMQFPDDVLYSNECGIVELFSKSRLGRSDLGVNTERLDDLVEFLMNYEFKTTCQ